MRTLGNIFALGNLSLGAGRASILWPDLFGPLPPAVDEVSPPDPPTILSLTALEGGFSYTLEAPVDDGGAPVTGYRIYTGAEGDETLVGSSSGLTGTVSGLAALQVRTTARALNSEGPGDYSAPVAITPLEISVPLSILRDGTSFAVTGSLNADLELDVDDDTVADYTIPTATLQGTIDAPQFVSAPALSLSGQTLSIDPGVIVSSAAEGEPTIAWDVFRPDGVIVATGADTMDTTYETVFSDEGLSVTLRVTATYGEDRPVTIAQAMQVVPSSTDPVTEDFGGYAAGTLLTDTTEWERDPAWSTVDATQGARVSTDGELVFAPGSGLKERLFYQPALTADRRVGLLYKGGTGSQTTYDTALFVDYDPVTDSNLKLEIDGSSGIILKQRTSGKGTTNVGIRNGAAPIGRYEVTRIGNEVTVYLDGVLISGPHTVAAFPNPGKPALQFALYDGSSTITVDDFNAEDI